MNNHRSLYYFLVFLVFVTVCNAQSNDSILKYEQNLYTKSYTVLNLDVIPISKIKSFLKKGKTLAVNFSEKKDINADFIEVYKLYNRDLIVISESIIDDYIIKDLNVIYMKPSNLEIVNLVSGSVPDSSQLKFSKTDKFRYFKAEEEFELSDSLFFKIWMRSGKYPRFIEPNKTSVLKADSTVTFLNGFRKIYGTVKTENGQLIDGVKFKDYKHSIVNGDFSFPIIEKERLPILIPYKAGYHFSPDIIYTTPANLKNSKDFKAFQLDLEYGLSDHFVFAPNFKNRIKKSDEELLLNNIEIKDDPIRGRVGYFRNRSYIDTGIKSKKSLQESFTIAAWIKPISLDINNSILGKGNNFVVKIRNGFLTFTMAGIKDYISESSPIPLDKWTHIALTHSKIDNTLFFYIDGKLTEEIKLISEYVTSDYNILIGSNLWEEFFEGYLSDIRIWERELNGNEIAILFEKKDENPLKKALKMGVAILPVFLIIILIAVLRKRKFKSKETLLKKKQGQFKKRQVLLDANHGKNENLESILCFGKLRLLNKEGVDIAEKLSPLLKKIFVIVFLYSQQGNKKGISTKQLTEVLWPGMSIQKAKNTRGTNINNLRTILNSCSAINLVFKNKSWLIELNEYSYCDYQVIQDYLDVFSEGNYSIKELETELPKFLGILKEGRLFSSSSESWLDPFIEKFSNQIIEQCLDFTDMLNVEKHSDLLLLLTEVICIYDDLNERAHQLKLRALIQQGKLSLAYKTYDNFIKLYYKIYKETYSISFEKMTSK